VNDNIIQDDRHLVFIVGVGRSGTTLLQCKLNAHPDVCFPPETHFFRFYVQNGRFEKIMRQKGATALLEHLNNDKYLKRLKCDIDGLFERTYVNNQLPSADRFYLRLLSEYSNRINKRIIGDKDPRNIEYLSDLHRYFPDATIIHMIRDPRDVIVSRLKADWSKGRILLSHVFTYKFQIQIGRQMGNKFFGDRYHEVIYEQLLSEPYEVLKQVCKILDISYSSKMLDFASSAKEIISNSEMQWKKETLGPLLKENWGKWKNHLTHRQILLIEQCCPEVFHGNLYSISNIRQKEGKSSLFFVKIVSAILSVLCGIYGRWRSLK
jgi:hypothetical protein